MERWDVLKKAMLAGFCISIGAAIYLSCTSKIVGAVMFAVGLFAICVFGLNLFTGKIGYVLVTRNRPDCLLIWLGKGNTEPVMVEVPKLVGQDYNRLDGDDYPDIKVKLLEEIYDVREPAGIILA